MRRFAGIELISDRIPDENTILTTTANVHDLTPTATLLHDEETVVYGDAGYQHNAEWPEIARKITEFWVAMRPSKCLILA
jgi:IS5 family transposase